MWASIAALLFSIYKLITSPIAGDAIFPFIIALLLFFSEAQFVPKNFSSSLRKMFKYGDKYARLSIFVIAVGGTALTIKFFSGLSLIPDTVDFWFKRSAPPLVATAIVLYISSVLSKVTYYLSDVEKDISINRFEFMYYISIVTFCISIFMAFMGLDYVDTLVTSQVGRTGSPYVWSTPTLKLFFCITIVALIWSICYGLCVFSRFCEWSLRERFQNKGAANGDGDMSLLDDG
ncbi:hypothetical protein CO653_33330 [Rhizobium anhuiense]|nr:hypothetical protein CO653_33330 [Rhizobium anhuiense]